MVKVFIYAILGIIVLAIGAYTIMKFGVIGFGRGKEFIEKNKEIDVSDFNGTKYQKRSK